VKLLLDQSLPRLTGHLLRQLGHEAVHASEIGMRLSPDIDYLTRAAIDGSVVVTLDADFHSLLAKGAMTSPSTVHLRLHNPDENLATEVIDALCRQYHVELLIGCVISYKPGSTRLRPLPIKTN